jgi:hypothetical protein
MGIKGRLSNAAGLMMAMIINVLSHSSWWHAPASGNLLHHTRNMVLVVVGRIISHARDKQCLDHLLAGSMGNGTSRSRRRTLLTMP